MNIWLVEIRRAWHRCVPCEGSNDSMKFVGISQALTSISTLLWDICL